MLLAIAQAEKGLLRQVLLGLNRLKHNIGDVLSSIRTSYPYRPPTMVNTKGKKGRYMRK